ncbi:unnamed protein product, partial [Allacma fusca]
MPQQDKTLSPNSSKSSLKNVDSDCTVTSGITQNIVDRAIEETKQDSQSDEEP